MLFIAPNSFANLYSTHCQNIFHPGLIPPFLLNALIQYPDNAFPSVRFVMRFSAGKKLLDSQEASIAAIYLSRFLSKQKGMFHGDEEKVHKYAREYLSPEVRNILKRIERLNLHGNLFHDFYSIYIKDLNSFVIQGSFSGLGELLYLAQKTRFSRVGIYRNDVFESKDPNLEMHPLIPWVIPVLFPREKFKFSFSTHSTGQQNANGFPEMRLLIAPGNIKPHSEFGSNSFLTTSEGFIDRFRPIFPNLLLLDIESLYRKVE